MSRAVLWFGALVLAGAMLIVAAILATTSPASRVCTHGVSSVGPVVLVDGKVVADPKPHTKACLP